MPTSSASQLAGAWSALLYMRRPAKACLCVASLFLLLPAPALKAAPVIGVEPNSLTFTGQVYSAISPQTLTVSNTGDAPLDYSIQSDVFRE